MDANKLIRIISKDLEELKTLTSEIAESENDSYLMIDLALSRARLLCQEIELLKEITVEPIVPVDEEEEEVSDEVDKIEEEVIEEDFELTEDVELEVEDKRNVEETDEDSNDDLEEEDLEDEEDEIEDEEEFEEENDSEFDETEDENKDDARENELKPVQQSGIREIQIEDLDEEESGSIQFTPASSPVERPVMREIPKPEIPLEEKEEDETFQKERSLNDVISENKSAETTLGNSPISSLRSSIGLNDRFLFIREIFSNNTDKYNMVIDHLDKLETIQQAVDYLKSNLTLQKNETSLKFVDLLKRRFTK